MLIWCRDGKLEKMEKVWNEKVEEVRQTVDL